MRRSPIVGWAPVVLIPAVGLAVAPEPGWLFMWALAASLFAGVKWLTWWGTPTRASVWRHAAYLLLWPGLDARAFLAGESSPPPAGRWVAGVAKSVMGAALVWFVARRVEDDVLRGWTGMIGLILLLHFGTFDLFASAWRTLGVDASPLMEAPIRSTSVAEFWGRRWNTAFRDLTHRFLFRPLAARVGARAAVWLAFLFSGIVHDVVISVPARGGFGGPTLFFLLQPAAMAIERRFGPWRGPLGWAFTFLFLGPPLALLFHAPFVRRIILPFLDGIGA